MPYPCSHKAVKQSCRGQLLTTNISPHKTDAPAGQCGPQKSQPPPLLNGCATNHPLAVTANKSMATSQKGGGKAADDEDCINAIGDEEEEGEGVERCQEGSTPTNAKPQSISRRSIQMLPLTELSTSPYRACSLDTDTRGEPITAVVDDGGCGKFNLKEQVLASIQKQMPNMSVDQAMAIRDKVVAMWGTQQAVDALVKSQLVDRQPATSGADKDLQKCHESLNRLLIDASRHFFESEGNPYPSKSSVYSWLKEKLEEDGSEYAATHAMHHVFTRAWEVPMTKSKGKKKLQITLWREFKEKTKDRLYRARRAARDAYLASMRILDIEVGEEESVTEAVDVELTNHIESWRDNKFRTLRVGTVNEPIGKKAFKKACLAFVGVVKMDGNKVVVEKGRDEKEKQSFSHLEIGAVAHTIGKVANLGYKGATTHRGQKDIGDSMGQEVVNEAEKIWKELERSHEKTDGGMIMVGNWRIYKAKDFNAKDWEATWGSL